MNGMSISIRIRLSTMMLLQYIMFAVWWQPLAAYPGNISIERLYKAAILISVGLGCLAAALAIASQKLEDGCGGSERLYHDDPTKRKAREQEVRRLFDRRFAGTANQFREQLTNWFRKERAGKIKYAEAFEICEYGRRPSKKEILKMFPFFPSLI